MLPQLNWPTLRLDAERTLRGLQHFLDAEDKEKGIRLGIFAVVDGSMDCPSNLYPLRDVWVHGRKNADLKEVHRLKVASKALRLGDYLRDFNMAAMSVWNVDRDREKGRKGGAIRVPYFIPEFGSGVTSLVLSASGTNERADEAFLLKLAKLAPWKIYDCDFVEAVLTVSKNQLARDFLAQTA